MSAELFKLATQGRQISQCGRREKRQIGKFGNEFEQKCNGYEFQEMDGCGAFWELLPYIEHHERKLSENKD